MGELKATPGEWTMCRDGECRCGQVFGEDGHVYVAHVYGPGNVGLDGPEAWPIEECYQANFHLIAAAPDLYAALELIRTQWAGHSEACAYLLSEYKSKCDCDWPMIAETCDAALSKARGEQ